MRILLVTHYFSTHRGGVESVAQCLAQRLAQEPDVAMDWMASDCDATPDGLPPRLRYIPARSCNAIERCSGLPYPLWSWGAIRRLWQAVTDCDVVHLHDSLYMGNVLAFVFARRQRRPVIVTQHVGEIGRARWLPRAALWLLNRTLARMVLSGADRVFFISPAVQRYFDGFCAFRTAPAYLPNGVDGDRYAFASRERMLALRSEAGRDPGRPLCLFVGRFVRRKGVDLVLSVARQLPGVDWILAGNGPLRPEDAGLPNVSVLRARSAPDIVALYQMADLLVLPSTGEGFPLVVQEALACGTPALVSAETAAGCPAMAPMLFTESLLAAASWRSRIERLLEDRERLHAMREKLAAAARTQWSWQAAADAYLEAMRGAVRQAAADGRARPGLKR